MKKVFAIIAFLFIAPSVLAVPFDSNVPQAVQDQMLQDLDFMSSIQGESKSSLHNEIFGKMDGEHYSQFFTSHIKSVGLSDCGNPNAVACVILFYPNKMWITNNYIKFSHPQISRLMVVYHEARHTERQNGGWSHARCPRPFLDDQGNDKKSIWTGASLAGEAACDVTAFGSYGSSTILLKAISNDCTNCNEKVKMDAGIYSADQLERVINAEAKNRIKEELFKEL